METFSAVLALYAGNSPVTGEFPSQRPVTRSFSNFFKQHLDKRLSKQSKRWWFETPPCSFWRHCNGFKGKCSCVCISEPPVCSSNVTRSQTYVAGEFVSFTCSQHFHPDVWPPSMQWYWLLEGCHIPTENWTNGRMVEYTAVVQMVPEYDGRLLKCDITFDPLPTGTYPVAWDFATNQPGYYYEYTTPVEVLCKYCIKQPFGPFCSHGLT